MADYVFDNLPINWEDINLELFQEIKRLYAENEGKPSQAALLALLSNKDEKEIREIPAIVIDEVIGALLFLKDPATKENSNTIEIDGEIYRINIEEELKFGEFVDCNTVMESDETNLAAILAIICRKEGEVYNDDFIAKKLNSRIEMFKKQPMTKIQPLVNFFLIASTTSVHFFQSFSENLKAQVSHILDNYETLMKNGRGRRLYTAWQMRKLRKLKKSLKNI
jgi:hypothetical protein